MKWEYLKGSEKDFEFYKDEFLTLWRTPVKSNVIGSTRKSDGHEIAVEQRWELIAERRPITEPVWSGDGLPPVGARCEFIRAIHWYSVEILYISGYHVVVKGEDGAEQCYQTSACQFRPIRSPEDVAREKIRLNMLQYMYSSDETDYAQVCKIYDAIAAGEIPGVKLE